jgi:hypothetical protein
MANLPLPGPWSVMERERGTVTISQLGDDRHQVSVRGSVDLDEVVDGQGAAEKRAVQLAEQLGPPIQRSRREWPMFSHRHRGT